MASMSARSCVRPASSFMMTTTSSDAIGTPSLDDGWFSPSSSDRPLTSRGAGVNLTAMRQRQPGGLDLKQAAGGGAAVMGLLSVTSKDIFGDAAFLIQAALLGSWLVAGAVVTWRRTPLRGIPVLFATLTGGLVWVSTRVSSLTAPIVEDPWRLVWTIPIVLGISGAAALAHKYDARRHPRAQDEFVRAIREASWLDFLTHRHVPTIEIDRFADPRARQA